MDKQVLIVGAGPIGLTLAMALTRQAVPVRIIEKNAVRSPYSKALIVWSRTLEMLEIEGIAQDFVAAGIPARGAAVWAEGKQRVQLRFAEAGIATDYPAGVLLAQSETERLLENHLATLGVHVEREVELIQHHSTPDGISATLRHADGRIETAQAAWLAACDGAHSTVRHQLDTAEFAGDTLPTHWLLADVKLASDLPRDEVSMFLAHDGLLIAIPFGDGRFRVMGDIGQVDRASLPEPTLADIQHLLDTRSDTPAVAQDPAWISHFVINERMVREYRYGRVFLLGDAAHIHSPAGGQGMNTGMQDAINLAWKLALHSHGLVGEALLDSYSSERSAIADQVLRKSGNLTRLALIHNPLLQHLRSATVSALGHLDSVRRTLAQQFTELDLHYPDSPLNRALPGASTQMLPGDRAPNAGLNAADGSRTLYALLAQGRFVVATTGATPVTLSEDASDIALGTTVLPQQGYEDGRVYVIRPDAYLACSANLEHLEDVNRYLETLRASGHPSG
ncbi:FAD-dependent monooxygenase [Amantichitinum ursilacus]|uniref:Pentachlorophenol 4-monooxygenase n=1 Tax=Amantichitinum ursilacus TaxID=857265 RepID=A0A0N0GQ69_9NEIS|nr:FAD-dependent monooxygenase [Amantichitinum ursilacus]KPC54153.1 Pentachlorophenol 4-monooxygenase [Amantichitinum ursilacus]